MHDAEERLFATGEVDAEPLMEQAALGCARIILQRCPVPGRAILFVGKGNNGGDALVIGRLLRAAGWRVEARLAGEPEEMTQLAAKKLSEFEAQPDGPGVTGGEVSRVRLVLIDGLLGIGARGALRGVLAEMAEEMNSLRGQQHALTFAVDIPSGVDGDSGEVYQGAVIADHTLTIARVKSGLVSDDAINAVGRIDVVPLPQIGVNESVSDTWLMTAESLRGFLPQRPHDFHKGDAGRVAIVAGSPGMIGAAELCARGALRGGAGLVNVFAHPSIYQLLASRAPAEVMVRKLDDEGSSVREANFDVLAIGPGIGAAPPEWMLRMMVEDSRPMVLDADALNALAGNPEHFAALAACTAPRLLTPHPGEMNRLVSAAGVEGKSNDDRRSMAGSFASSFGVTLLLKGARTVIAQTGEPTAINSTGNPGMASGGMGDVLTGLCAALQASTGCPYRAACLGAWFGGRSADLLIDAGARSVESLSAVDVAEGLGAAFDDLRGSIA